MWLEHEVLRACRGRTAVIASEHCRFNRLLAALIGSAQPLTDLIAVICSSAGVWAGDLNRFTAQSLEYRLGVLKLALTAGQ